MRSNLHHYYGLLATGLALLADKNAGGDIAVQLKKNLPRDVK